MEKRIDTLLRLEDTPSSFQLGDDQYLVLTHTIQTAAGPIHLVAARNDETTALILDRLTAALLIGAAVLILGFGAASWLLARAALRPVSRMREQAERIAGEERTRREESTGLLTVGPAEDELSALATTLNDLIRRLRASAERERQMVSDASHELRTPLAVLRGQLELAELDAGDAESLLSDIRSSHATAIRLGQLANNLLELSRIEAGPSSGRIDWRTFADELTDAVDRARLLVSSDDDEGRISIDYDYDPRQRPDPDARVALSPTDVGRILDNLLGNAITAIRSASLKEAAVTASLSVSGPNVVLTVRDTGPGMPADFIPVALDRFTRADGARTSRSGTGGGLGLAIVAALADAAGGEVVLANGEPTGLTVTVTLPLVRDAA
jgi:signal transduction histidine kinase